MSLERGNLMSIKLKMSYYPKEHSSTKPSSLGLRYEKMSPIFFFVLLILLTDSFFTKLQLFWGCNKPIILGQL